jgi:RimJ/RimL family protein N-acetyltransferase
MVLLASEGRTDGSSSSKPSPENLPTGVRVRNDRSSRPNTTRSPAVRRIVDRLAALRHRFGDRLADGVADVSNRARSSRRDGAGVSSVADETENRAVSSTAPPADANLIREGNLVRLRAHVVANRPAFQRWYADEEIARLLRHDQRPLNAIQSRSYFDTLIMPLSARGMCFAIHEAASDRLIGTSALTDIEGADKRTALFRIVIGEKDCWGRGYGTEATRLVVEEAFERLHLDRVRLEVFRHNARALAAYHRVGFRETGQHVEYVGRARFELHVIEMALDRADYELLANPQSISLTEDAATDAGDEPVIASPRRSQE